MTNDSNFHSNRSLVADANKVRALRQNLGWTQPLAAERSGYSLRLIQKLENGGGVRPTTLSDVLQCYHEAMDQPEWHIQSFIVCDIPADHQIPPGHQAQIDRIKQWYTNTYVNRDRSGIHQYLHDQIVFRHADGPPQRGIATVEKLVDIILGAFNPIEIEFEHCFFHEGCVFTFFKARQKHVGFFNGIEATNQWLEVHANSRVRFAGDKVIEANDYWDVHGLTLQLRGGNPNFP